MRPRQTEKLYEDFPELFTRDTLTRGFECQDGWFDILRYFAERIMKYFGYSLFNTNLKITRIKQHMGELIIIAEGADENVHDIINETESRSRSVCEIDGAPAINLYVCAPHWFRHLCEQCAEMHGCMTIEDYRFNHLEKHAVQKFT